MIYSAEQAIAPPPRRVQFTYKTMWIRKTMLSAWILALLFCGRQSVTQATIRRRWEIPLSNPPLEYISYDFMDTKWRRIYSEVPVRELLSWGRG
jgi:hypothetical protein